MTDLTQATNTYHKLSSIVDMACHRVGISVDHYFQTLLEWGKWELIQLKLDRANEPVTVLLDVNDVNTVTLPPDAIDWTKIGTPYGQYVKTLGINSELSKQDRTLGNPEFSKTASPGWLPNGTAIQNYGGYEFLNYGGRSLFAIGGGLPSEGHFQVKRKPGCIEILLDGNVGCEQLYVEYIRLGINPCGATVLDPYIADYILKAILFTYEEEKNPTRTEASIARRGREKFFAFTLVSGRTNSIDKDTLLNSTRRYYNLSPRA